MGDAGWGAVQFQYSLRSQPSVVRRHCGWVGWERSSPRSAISGLVLFPACWKTSRAPHFAIKEASRPPRISPAAMVNIVRIRVPSSRCQSTVTLAEPIRAWMVDAAMLPQNRVASRKVDRPHVIRISGPFGPGLVSPLGQTAMQRLRQRRERSQTDCWNKLATKELRQSIRFRPGAGCCKPATNTCSKRGPYATPL